MTSLRLNCLILLFSAVVCYRGAGTITVLSNSQVNVINAGDTVLLDCRFNATSYNMFDYPLLWRKIQRGEDTQVNIMGNVNQPFLATGRYDVSFSSAPPEYMLKLQITDVIQEDSGNYTCEVRGPHSVVLGHVTHFVLVRSPLEAIYLTDSLDDVTSASQLHMSSTRPVLRVTDNTPSVVRCIVDGGFPPPNVAIHVGQRDITNDFRFVSRANVTGSRGLRLMTYRSERAADKFVARRDENGQRVQCIGSVPGLKPVAISAILDVLYGPTISCQPETARVGDANVNLKCEIRSNPRVFALFWIMDDNGTTLAEGEVIDETWTLVMDRPDKVVEAQLYLHRLDASSFRTYTLVAENSISTAATDIRLTQLTSTPDLSHSASGGISSLSVQQQSMGFRSNSSTVLTTGSNISVRSLPISGHQPQTRVSVSDNQRPRERNSGTGGSRHSKQIGSRQLASSSSATAVLHRSTSISDDSSPYSFLARLFVAVIAIAVTLYNEHVVVFKGSPARTVNEISWRRQSRKSCSNDSLRRNSYELTIA